MGDEPVSERSIQEATSASLKLAARNGVARIAFPVLGSGIGGFDLRRAAEVMRDVIVSSPDGETLDDVTFFGFSPNDAETLREVMK